MGGKEEEGEGLLVVCFCYLIYKSKYNRASIHFSFSAMIWTVLVLTVVAVALVRASTQEHMTSVPDAATSCFPPNCTLPNCFCSEDGSEIPGNLWPDDTPQMIILSFEGPLNGETAEKFGYLLNDTRKNPNGCPIKATFFVSHSTTSYHYVQKLYSQGHEIAMQTITKKDIARYGSADLWAEEVVGMKEMLHGFANISRDDLRGVRSPDRKPSGNNMMSMIYDYGIEYDSSLSAPLSDSPLWPYTMDYRIPHECLLGNCPSRSFPGVWEFPLNTMNDGTSESCVFLHNCRFPITEEEILNFIYNGFLRHYTTNKAPFLLDFSVYLNNDSVKLDLFIDHILENFPDAWFVTMHQAVEWMRNPVNSTFALDFEGWKCQRTRQSGCNIPRTCKVKFSSDDFERFFGHIQVCGRCPKVYPWLYNIWGTENGMKVQDIYFKSP